MAGVEIMHFDLLKVVGPPKAPRKQFPKHPALGNRRIILLAWVQCIINGGEDNLALIWEMIVYVGCRLRC